ncbi:hypothetical protein CL656_01870 [bacterium]|nr:hypothetical protein [bacterium]|tara:strand:+ start:5420 stop:9049 length:3630 start_codon:yes stop_codon:yes gene_type:complete
MGFFSRSKVSEVDILDQDCSDSNLEIDSQSINVKQDVDNLTSKVIKRIKSIFSVFSSNAKNEIVTDVVSASQELSDSRVDCTVSCDETNLHSKSDLNYSSKTNVKLDIPPTISSSRIEDCVFNSNLPDEIVSEYVEIQSLRSDHNNEIHEVDIQEFNSDNDNFANSPFLNIFKKKGYFDFSDIEIENFNNAILSGQSLDELKFTTYITHLNSVSYTEEQKLNFEELLLNHKVDNSIEFGKFLFDLSSEKLDKSQELRFNKILLEGNTENSVAFTFYYLNSIKPNLEFTDLESMQLDDLLLNGEMNVDIQNSLKDRLFFYLVYLKENQQIDLSYEEDYMLNEFSMRRTEEIDDSLIKKVNLRSSFSVYKNIFLKGACEIDRKVKKSIDEKLEFSGDIDSQRSEQLIDEFIERSSKETHDCDYDTIDVPHLLDDYDLNFILNPDNFDEIFKSSMENIITSSNRAVDMSTNKSLFEFNVWSNGKDNPNQDSAIAFDEGMVLCDGAGSAPQSELVSAFFSNFIYSYRDVISHVISLLSKTSESDLDSKLKKFFSDILAFASLKFKEVHPELINVSYSTLSIVFKLDSKSVNCKKFISLTIGDSPVLKGDSFVSGHNDLIDIVYDDSNPTHLDSLKNYLGENPNFIESELRNYNDTIPSYLFDDIWFIDDSKINELINSYNLITILKFNVRNIITSCIPNFSSGYDLDNLSNLYSQGATVKVFEYNPNQPVLICSDGLSDNFTNDGILDISLTDPDDLDQLNFQNSNFEKSDINKLIRYKPDDSTVVRLDLKSTYLEESFEPVVDLDMILSEMSTDQLLTTDNEFDLESFISSNLDSLPKRTESLVTNKGNWFSRKFKSCVDGVKNISNASSTYFTSFTSLKNKILTFDFAKALNKTFSVLFLSRFSVAIYALLMSSYNDLQFVELSESAEIIQQGVDFIRGYFDSLGLCGEMLLSDFESLDCFDHSNEINHSLTQDNHLISVDEFSDNRNSNNHTLASFGNSLVDSELNTLAAFSDQNDSSLIENFSSFQPEEEFECLSEEDIIFLSDEDMEYLSEDEILYSYEDNIEFINDEDIEYINENNYQDSDSLTENSAEEQSIMTPNSYNFINVNCDISDATLSENGVESLNPSDTNINTDISYSVNLNDEDSSLLKRDDTGRVIGRLSEGDRFQFTGSTDLVSANNGSDDILYAEAKTSDGKTFWVARAYAKPMAS